MIKLKMKLADRAKISNLQSIHFMQKNDQPVEVEEKMTAQLFKTVLPNVGACNTLWAPLC